jgi:hypothetical protein
MKELDAKATQLKNDLTKANMILCAGNQGYSLLFAVVRSRGIMLVVSIIHPFPCPLLFMVLLVVLHCSALLLALLI